MTITSENIKGIYNKAVQEYKKDNNNEVAIKTLEQIYKFIEDNTKGPSAKDVKARWLANGFYDIRTLDLITEVGKYYLSINKIETAREYAKRWLYWSILNGKHSESEKPNGVKSSVLNTDDNVNYNNGCLFQYRKIDKYLLQNIIKNTITLNNPKNFNDPIDCTFLYIDKLITPKNDFAQLVLQEASNVRVGCFTINKKFSAKGNAQKNILMWSHYAESHRGVCIKYKVKDCSILDNWSNANMSNVKRTFKVEYNNSMLNDNKAVLKQSIRDMFALKSKDWKYEKELRVISFDENCNKDYYDIDLEDSMVIEAVYFGYSCSDEDIELIKKAINNKRCKYRKATINKKGPIFDFKFVKC